MQLAALPPEALKLYRDRVDPVARKWYEQGIANRDPKPLRNIVDQAFASSFGDDALMALGQIALESGDFAAARWDWERIVPVRNPDPAVPQAWPSYPDTNLDLAAVRARLVLVSILEGATERARGELAAYRKLHPTHRAVWAAARGDTFNYWNRCWPRASPGPPRRWSATG